MPGVSLRDTGGLVLTLQRRLYTLGPTELRGRPDEHGLQTEGPLEGTTGGHLGRGPATLPAQGSHMQPCLHYQRGF